MAVVLRTVIAVPGLEVTLASNRQRTREGPTVMRTGAAAMALMQALILP
jgi:hypothetical protein